MRTLGVWWATSRVGSLTQDDFGDLSFVYDSSWIEDPRAQPLSVSLPKRTAPYSSRPTRAFFDGLLPEADTRRVVAQILGVSPGNPFALLEHLGGEVAGALSLLPPELPPRLDGASAPEVLDPARLEAVLRELPMRPFLADGRRRLSLAGVQNKLPVIVVEDQIALPGPGTPSTHILKIPDERFTGMVENEAFVLCLAKRSGLRAVSAAPRAVAQLPFLLVERYDRALASDGVHLRMHQEDFCQALGVLPERKYASEGGPGFRQCFELVRRVATIPATETLALLDYAIFNVIVGNADAHGKNYSLLYRDGTTLLAPLYDALSTVVYPELNARLAMTVDGKTTLDQISRVHWERFAMNIGFAKAFVPKRVGRLAERMLEEIDAVVEALLSESIDVVHVRKLAETVSRRCEIAVQNAETS